MRRHEDGIPRIPERWDYGESVRKVKQVIYKWKNLTVELATELWIAREILSAPGKRTDLEPGQTWIQYCKDICVERMTVHRWLNRYFPNLVTKVTRSIPLPPGTYGVIYADPPWQFSNSGLEESAASHYSTMELEEICAEAL